MVPPTAMVLSEFAAHLPEEIDDQSKKLTQGKQLYMVIYQR